VNDQPSPIEEPEKSPFQFWAAYIPGVGTQRYYLSNGKEGKQKGLRLFKSPEAADKFLKDELEAGRLKPEIYDKIVVHPIEGKLALPEELDRKPLPLKIPTRLKAPGHLRPIATLDQLGVPTSLEVLQNYERRKKRRRH
jgi:hypothetical protein